MARFSDSEYERISKNEERNEQRRYEREGRDIWGNMKCQHYNTVNISPTDFRQECRDCGEILPLSSGRKCKHLYTSYVTKEKYDTRLQCRSCGQIIY